MVGRRRKLGVNFDKSKVMIVKREDKSGCSVRIDEGTVNFGVVTQ